MPDATMRRCLSAACLLLFSAASAGAGTHIMAGTSLVQELVREISGDAAPVQNLLQPDMCPGHFDVRPGDIERVADARMLLLQPWQRDLPGVSAVIAAARFPADRVRIVPVDGNWMVPDARAEAARAVGRLLAEETPERAEELLAAAEKVAEASLAVGEWARAEAAVHGMTGVVAACSEQQADLVRWLGIETAIVYGPAEGMSVAEADALARRVETSAPTLVIDNLQSANTRLGESLARQAGAAHVVLSNFPGAEPDEKTWEQTLRANVGRLVAAMAGRPAP